MRRRRFVSAGGPEHGRVFIIDFASILGKHGRCLMSAGFLPRITNNELFT